MKIFKLALVAAIAVSVLPACSATNAEGGVTRAELEEVRSIAKKARACCESNTARIDRMFEKAMAK
ncbi:MAG: alanine-zipper protein [Gammaproteobacteria bacterium SHHR-1]|uniref:alanine-zipper protein n=1 Tax=Magnetovirga frankeli TaxID=947516 RepID=UPI00129352AD|nr:hypothetical protein D5125_10965 [gamma proteobacterium SS-5]